MKTSGITKITKSALPSAVYSWVPQAKNVRNLPYTVTFSAKDDNCPIPGFGQRRFFIIVKDSLPTTKIQITDSGCGHFHIGLNPTPDKNYNVDYSWVYDTTSISNKPDFSYTNTLAGKHYIHLSIANKTSGCTEYLVDSVYFDTAYQKLPTQAAICKGDVVPLNAFKGSGQTWSPGKWLYDSTIFNPVAQPDATTVYTIKGTDIRGCTYTDLEKITVSDFKLITSGNKTICNGDHIKLFVNHVPGAIVQWSHNESLNKSTGDSVIASPGRNTTYKVTVNLNGCIKTDSINVIVNTTKYDLGPDKHVCEGDSVILFASGGTSFTWHNVAHINVILSTDSIYKIKIANNTIAQGVPYMMTMKNNRTGCLDTGFIKVYTSAFSPTHSLKSGDVCKGELLTYIALGGDEYKWTFPDKTTSTLTQVSIKPFATEKIVLTTKKNNVCSRTDTVLVYVPPLPVAYLRINICKGDTAHLSAKGGSQYTWGPLSAGFKNLYLQNQAIVPSSDTKYTVTIVDSAVGCVRTDTQHVFVMADCVWPGDANKDKAADYLDVLNIGVGYGIKGPARNKGTEEWKQYWAADWDNSLNSGINFKHFDCNGDGVINAKDTAIINVNYGQKHSKWSAGTGNPADPPVYFKFAKDTFFAGDTAIAYLYAGRLTNPLKNAYGIGYQANFSGLPVAANSGKIAPFCDYFCKGTELNYLRADYPNNKFAAVTVETNGNNVSTDSGKIAVLKFKLLDSFNHAYSKNGERIFARLLAATAIDNTAKELNIYGINDSAIVLGSHRQNVGIDNNVLILGLKIYPNPANNELIIENGNIFIKKVIMYNAIGQVIFGAQNMEGQKTIDLSSVPPGMYCIQINTPEATLRQKILIQH